MNLKMMDRHRRNERHTPLDKKDMPPPRARTRKCRFCPAEVDNDPISMARHLLARRDGAALCPAPAEAQEIARQTLDGARELEIQQTLDRARKAGVLPDQIGRMERELREVRAA
jgi:hypothetical protein